MLNLNYGFKHPVRRVTPISPSPREWTPFSVYDGIDVDSSSSVFDVVSSTPDNSAWPGGDRWLVCFATAYTSVDYSVKGKHK